MHVYEMRVNLRKNREQKTERWLLCLLNFVHWLEKVKLTSFPPGKLQLVAIKNEYKWFQNSFLNFKMAWEVSLYRLKFLLAIINKQNFESRVTFSEKRKNNIEVEFMPLQVFCVHEKREKTKYFFRLENIKLLLLLLLSNEFKLNICYILY